MNQLITSVTTVAKSWHVSVPLVLALVCEAGKIWIPAAAVKFDATQKLLYTYGIGAASLIGSSKHDNLS